MLPDSVLNGSSAEELIPKEGATKEIGLTEIEFLVL
jgi:hypothetical protein